MASSTSTEASLGGRLALVTGGGSGIGKAVCEVLCSEGALIIAAGTNKEATAATVKSLPGSHDHLSVAVNVGSSDSVTAMFQEIRSRYAAPPTIVVNCAGITRIASLLNMTEAMFDDVVRINLKGTFLITQAAAREMVADRVREGSIVNISSIVGKSGSAGVAGYAASKAGVVGFTKSVARELAHHNIRCNAVMPGIIETRMTSSVPDDVLARLIPNVPLNRMGKPEEVAEVVKFLCSPSSAYITGAVLEVTGGLETI